MPAPPTSDAVVARPDLSHVVVYVTDMQKLEILLLQRA